MPVPILNLTTSLLIFDRGRFNAFQPALAPGSSAATGWSLLSGGLPEGMALNATTGRISGVPGREAEGSVFNVQIVASNGSGASEPLDLVIGVAFAPMELDGAQELIFDLDHGGVAFSRFEELDDLGRPVVRWKRGDKFPLAIICVKGGQVVDIPISQVAITAAQVEGERRIDLNPGRPLLRQGEYDLARWQTVIDLTDSYLRTIIGSEDPGAGQSVLLSCELEFQFFYETGDVEEPEALATRTSATFGVRLYRDLTL